MHFLKKVIFLLLFIISFSCKTKLEKQGWQRTAIVSQFDTSTVNKKDKELVVFKMKHKYTYHQFNFFEKDSTGKIINKQSSFVIQRLFKSDLAYYKWESDSVCLIKLLNQGNVQASLRFTKFNDSTEAFSVLEEPGQEKHKLKK